MKKERMPNPLVGTLFLFLISLWWLSYQDIMGWFGVGVLLFAFIGCVTNWICWFKFPEAR